MAKRLDILGAGQVGRALARAWAIADVFEVNRVCNRSWQSAMGATRFIGEGRAVSTLEGQPAEFLMISASDSSIAACVEVVLAAKILSPGSVVFHCSGAISFDILSPLREQGALIAGLHPIKSFADPESATTTLSQTPCCLEGDETAVARLRDAMLRLGAKPFQLHAHSKLVYHAGSAFACGNLIATLSAGLECLRLSGLSDDESAAILKPIALQTVEAFFQKGPSEAYSGPISRGEVGVVERQVADLESVDPQLAYAYKALGALALRIVERKGKHSRQTIETFQNILNGRSKVLSDI